jgi:hypothetical protein
MSSIRHSTLIIPKDIVQCDKKLEGMDFDEHVKQ